MALFALSNLGFVTPVPRQEDQFGVDFIVHLAEQDGQNLVASGRCFAIQIKSSIEPLGFKKERDVRCLNGLTIPYFIGIVSKEDQTLAIYSTLTRLCHMWKFGREVQVELIPGSEGENAPMPDWDNHRVPLGGPVYKVELAELDDLTTKKQVRASFYKVMSYWIKLEEAALAWKEHSVPLVFWQSEHQTNQLPTTDKQVPWVAANPNSFPEITKAVLHSLVSFRFYLVDILNRAETGELPLSAETQSKASELMKLVDSLSQLSERVVSGIGSDVSTSRESARISANG